MDIAIEYNYKLYFLSEVKFTLQAPAVETRCIDVTDWEATRQCVQDLCPIDLLVNSAGILRGRSVLESTKDDIDR